MDRRTLYEQSKEPYRFSLNKLLFLSVRFKCSFSLDSFRSFFKTTGKDKPEKI